MAIIHHRPALGRAAFNIAWYTLLPFGQTVVRRDEYTRVRRSRHRAARHARQNLIWLILRRLSGWARPSITSGGARPHHHRPALLPGRIESSPDSRSGSIGKIVITVDEAEKRLRYAPWADPACHKVDASCRVDPYLRKSV